VRLAFDFSALAAGYVRRCDAGVAALSMTNSSVIFRNRDGGAEQLAVARRRKIPAAFEHDVSLTHEEAVAGIPGGRRVDAGLAVVERLQHIGAATIGDLVDEPLVALTAIDRPQDLEVGGIGHRPVGILRGEADIDDNGIERVLGIDLTDDLSADALVLSDRPEAPAAEGR
jgi:hypothetical protein